MSHLQAIFKILDRLVHVPQKEVITAVYILKNFTEH